MKEPNNIEVLRDTLAMSQREIAKVLGISLRAVQSYEQGWRRMPPSVQKLVSLLLFFNWRKDHGPGKPCWEIKKCSSEERANCMAHRTQARECCWIVTGNFFDGKELKTWDAKLRKCLQCEVMRRWLNP